MPQLRFMATKMELGGARGSLGADDLVQAAVIKLIALRSRFDPTRSKWKTFALPRARWAMADACRELDHVPRLERKLARLEGRELPKIISADTSPRDLVPMDQPDRKAFSPLEAAQGHDAWARTVEILGVRRAQIVERRVRRGETLRQIGQALGLSESRICQIYNASMERLRLKWVDGREPS